MLTLIAPLITALTHRRHIRQLRGVVWENRTAIIRWRSPQCDDLGEYRHMQAQSIRLVDSPSGKPRVEPRLGNSTLPNYDLMTWH